MKKTVAKYLCIILSVAMLVTALPLTVHAANTWDPDNGVYDITTEEDLFAFKDSLDNSKQYSGIEINLLSDIKISDGRTYTSPCSYGDTNACFAGTFNGNNHTISNLNMVSSDNSTVSFFPNLNNATIKDLTLKDVTIENGYTWNAAFAPESTGDDKIINCHLAGNCVIKPNDNMDSANISGGIIGSNSNGALKIENCSVGDDDSNIKINTPGESTPGYSYSGGIIGYAYPDTTIEILSTDNYANIGCDNIAGGIVALVNGYPYGYNSFAKIIDCHNYGDIISVESTLDGRSCCGGIVAYSSMDSVLLIDRCANYGNITVNSYSTDSSGGVAGEIFCGAVLNTYNTGKVTSKTKTDGSLGGVVGHFRVDNGFEMPDTSFFDYYPTDYVNSIINCYNVGDVTGPQTGYVGGVCGYVQDFCTVEKRSVIRNAYNFAEVSGLSPTGTVCGAVQDTTITDVYGKSGPYALNRIEINSQNTDGVETCISKVGYFNTPDVNGTVYPATVKAKGVKSNEIIETISSASLSGNLLSLLNEKVKEYNAELEADGSNYRYLTWKMTNPASEDGSTGVSVHPMFGINDFTVNFYANFEDNEEPFRIYTVETLVNGKVPEFYDLPSHDGYIFKGWYLDKENSDDDSPISFDTVYSASTDIYAHWIKVEDVEQDEKDDNELPPGYNGIYGGFDLVGVQVREGIRDTNFGYEKKPGGLRFVTSLNMDVVNQINAIKPNKSNIEYGYVAATNEGWIDYHSKYTDRKLQYASTNTNGIDTKSDEATNDNYFGFASNINCTSRVSNGNGKVKEDHRNFDNYLLYTLVITYENVEDEESAKNTKVLARPYIKYFDANGLERVVYSEYRGNSNTLGGCYTSYNAIASNN